ncbi:hypothetical protein HYPSUDRAFT_100251, partial [Hypholoma sublateritium FD-334 SS-4]
GPSELLCLACGRNFAQSNAYSTHIRSCRPQRKRMASALELAKEAYMRKKSRTALNPPEEEQLPQLNLQPAEPPVDVKKRLPLRYRVDLPVQLPGLPPPFVAEPVVSVSSIPILISTGSHQVQLPTRQILKSPCNIFGLFRQYFTVNFPSHDPESELQFSDVSPSTSDGDKVEPLSTKLFQPYPNKNAFLLGEWYWNGGLQKSKEDFKNLMNIISDESFVPADIRDVPWDSLNARLGDSPDSEGSWFDQPDAGWKETTITLSIPFSKNALNPGLQPYTFPPFRHRSIVSVL